MSKTQGKDKYDLKLERILRGLHDSEVRRTTGKHPANNPWGRRGKPSAEGSKEPKLK